MASLAVRFLDIKPLGGCPCLDGFNQSLAAGVSLQGDNRIQKGALAQKTLFNRSHMLLALAPEATAQGLLEIYDSVAKQTD